MSSDPFLSQILDMPARLSSRLPAAVGASIVVAAMVLAIATFVVLTGLTPIVPTQAILVWAFVLNAILCLALILAVFWEIWPLWRASRRGQAAARLHRRVVAMFGFIAAVPAIVVAVIAGLTLDIGLDRWFSDRTRGIVDNSLTVARAYVNEHAQRLVTDLQLMAQDLNRAQAVSLTDPAGFQEFLNKQAFFRGLPASYLLKSDGSVVQRAQIQLGRHFSLPNADVIRDANGGDPFLIPSGKDEFGGLIKLTAFDDVYLFVARSIDPRVIGYQQQAEAGAAEYTALERGRSGYQAAFAVIYAGLSFILLLSAVWIGTAFANRLVSPIRRLIGAADQVSHGNLNVVVPVDPVDGDLAHLGQTFNIMTQKLRSQRDELVEANAKADAGRLFAEAVLEGATAGIVGIDPSMHITLVNRSALALIDMSDHDIIGRDLGELVPEFQDILMQAQSSGRLVQADVVLSRMGRERTLLVRVTGEKNAGTEHSFVVTLDDLTELVTAQRSSAWADVARRIAHEIKNPLTPIQLSAERLKRKYGSKIHEDKEVFDQCTDTIIRQVGDIGRMVDAFSSFARMPHAQMNDEDLADCIRQVAFLMRVGNPDIAIDVFVPEGGVIAHFDRRLISQALTNVVKNASEAIAATEAGAAGMGHIRIDLRGDEQFWSIDVEDNGIGLPTTNRQRLLEPYMTTRDKGTGLGLAIVRKIMEEHGGTIELADSAAVASGGQGALVRLTIARSVLPPHLLDTPQGIVHGR